MRAPLLALVLASSLALLHCDSSGSDAPTASGAAGSAGASGQGGQGSSDTLARALADCKEACSVIDGLKCFKNLPGDCDKACDSSAKKSCASEFAEYSACAKSDAWKCVDGFAQTSSCADSQKKLLDCITTKGQGSGELGSQGNFFCDKTVCDGSAAEKACCLKLDLTKFSTDARCVPSIDQCGEDSRWECDGPDDCGGRACCWANVSSGMGQIIVGLCRDACNPFAGEKEVCYDTCTGNQLCCKAPDDKTGTCQPDQATCNQVLAEQAQQDP